MRAPESGRSRGAARALPLAVTVVLALLLSLPDVRAAASDVEAGGAGDVATTEQRLQRAGVGPALRLRVHEAVQRGADWILARQTKEGAFLRPAAFTTEFGSDAAAVEAVCALALASAGEKPREEAARRTLRWMAVPGGGVRKEVRGRARAAGFAALLVRELGDEPDMARSLASVLLALQDPRTGMWSSGPAAGVPFGTIPRVSAGPQPADLPGTREALLGLAAAAASGVDVPAGVARRTLETLADDRDESALVSMIATLNVSTSARAAKRLAAFEAARALAERAAAPAAPVAAERDRVAERLRRVFGDEALDGFWAMGKPFQIPAAPPPWCWDTAAAALLYGAATLDGETWYPPLAEGLLARQTREGAWGTPGGATEGDALVDTAFAILALTRAAEPFARAVPQPAAAAVPGPWPDPSANPPSDRVPLEAAEDALAWLEGLVRDPDVRGPELLRFVLFVGRAYERLAPGADPKEAEEWHRRAEIVLVRAAVLEREEPERTNDLAAANLAAARLLAFARPRAAAPFRRALEREFSRTRDTALERTFLRAAFESLLRLEREESLLWMTGSDVLSTRLEEPDRLRTQEALRAAATCGSAPGAARREAMERICSALEGLESATLGFNINFKPAPPQPRAGERWLALRRFAIEALWRLGSDPMKRTPPVGSAGTYLLTMMEYRPWLRDHKDVAAAPWADR